MTDRAVARCAHVIPTPWGQAQCALPVHDEGVRHAYSPSEALDDLLSECEKISKPQRRVALVGTILPASYGSDDDDPVPMRIARVRTDIGMPEGRIAQAQHAITDLQVSLSVVPALSRLRERVFAELDAFINTEKRHGRSG